MDPYRSTDYRLPRPYRPRRADLSLPLASRVLAFVVAVIMTAAIGAALETCAGDDASIGATP